jgi:hypothetical protein
MDIDKMDLIQLMLYRKQYIFVWDGYGQEINNIGVVITFKDGEA